jgi:hypothetical protein
MVDKVFKVFVAVNVLCQFCPCRTSVDMHGQGNGDKHYEFQLVSSLHWLSLFSVVNIYPDCSRIACGLSACNSCKLNPYEWNISSSRLVVSIGRSVYIDVEISVDWR